jgi:small membrane protein
MSLFQWVVIVFLQIFFIGNIIIKKTKKRTLSLFDALFILCLDALLSIFLIFPALFFYLSNFFGIERGVDIFIYFGILILFYLVLRLYFKIEKLRQDITKLNRELSIKISMDKIN